RLGAGSRELDLDRLRRGQLQIVVVLLRVLLRLVFRAGGAGVRSLLLLLLRLAPLLLREADGGLQAQPVEGRAEAPGDGLAAVGRVHPAQLEEVLVFRLAAAKLQPGASDEREAVARGRPDRVGVVARRPRETLRRAAERRLPHMAALGVAPRDVRDPLAVGGE